MKRVAVLGGGPAGAFAAERLAAAGFEAVLLDEKLAWEKPCGGGVTWKAYREYPFLLDNDTPKKTLTRTCMASESGASASFDLDRPLLIYSRFELNRMMLDRAARAGADVRKARVLGLDRAGEGWRVRTSAGELTADFCIVAMGARNPIRDVGTEWHAGDTMSSLGYFIPGDREQVDLQFFPGFEGYIWVFPRDGHLSAGIAGKGRPTAQLKDMLHRYLERKGITTQGAQFYGHVIPSLEKPAWRSNRVSGEGWMAVGDSAGLVDPVTGEGIYYAIRSADLAADALIRHQAEAPAHYADAVAREFLYDLEIGARLSKSLFLGRFLNGDTTGRMIQFLRRSPTLRAVVQDLFAGAQDYTSLKARLKASMRGTALDLLLPWRAA